VHSHYTIKPV